MQCPKCGKEIANYSNVCPSCGVNTINQPPPQISAPVGNKPKKKYTGLIIGIIIAVVVFMLLGCCIIPLFLGAFIDDDESMSESDSTSVSITTENKEDKSENSEKATELSEEEIEAKCIDILNSTRAVNGYNAKLGPVLNAIFTDYEITIKKAWGLNNYDVTLSGSFIPVSGVSESKTHAEITYTVNIESNSCELKSDTQNIAGFVNAYVIDNFEYGVF